MNCPACFKDNTIRCAVAYLQGTSQASYEGTSSSRGTFLTADYDFGVLTSTERHSGRSQEQTSLARAAQPPEPITLKDAFQTWLGLSVVSYIVLAVLLCITLIPLGVQNGTVQTFILYITGLLSVPYFACCVRYYILGNQDYQREMERYKREWICLRCGHRWSPN